MTNNKRRRPRRTKTAQQEPRGPFMLDPFQEEAIGELAEGKNVLVAAPTGTGKTVIAEILIERVLESGRGVVYTSPIKALSNQKYRDFASRFGKEKVGLITGDVSVNERAPLLVMTTEIFRNWCFANPEMLDHTTHVVFDELHYLDDIERGTAWEESIIFAPDHIRVVGLSATVPNAREVASWIADVREQEVMVIEERQRAVPLELSWISPGGHVYGEEDGREYIRQRIERRKGRWASYQENDVEIAFD
ncbi:MAG: DEAD/DEAH box helicase [Bacillota bacterium]